MKELDQLMLDLKRKIFKPVYFLSGEEPYYIDLISNFIEDNALEAPDREFNQEIVYGKDVSLGQVIGLAKQFPMMSDLRVVIVKEAQQLKELSKAQAEGDEESGSKGASAQSQAMLTAYVQQPLKSTVLVFCYKYKTIDKRSALAKAIQKHAVFLEFKKLYDNQLPAWIGDYVKEKKYAIGPKATFLLSESIGNDLSRISGEIDKLVINLKPGAEITPELVQDYVGMSREFNVFELQAAIGSRDVLKANRIVSNMSDDKDTIMVVPTLYGFFTKILLYHAQGDKSKFAVAQALGVNPYFVEQYQVAASNYPEGKLHHIFSYLRECDVRSKGVDNPSVPAAELLRELLYKILH